MWQRNIGGKKFPGFSIGEVILSAAVITIGILATLSLLSGSRANERGSRDYIVGAQLAQEGAEIVRNIRDNNFASGGNGYADFSGFNHCTVDTGGGSYLTGARFYDCKNALPALSSALDATAITLNGIVYRRYVNVNYIASDPSADIVSFVYWGSWLPSGASLATLKSTCNRKSGCVYSEASLLGWK